MGPMSLHGWLRPAGRLLASFLAVTMLPAAALLWLSWRSLDQDRLLESERVRKRCEQAADLVVTALQQELAAFELHTAGDPPTGTDAVRLVFGSDRLETRPAHRLLYYPFLPPVPEAPQQIFAAGEALEFRQSDFQGAAAAFRTIAKSADPAIRAAAWLRVARNLRKAGKPAEALPAYDEMEHCGSVPVAGVPADLVARRARFGVLEELHRTVEARLEADRIGRDLDSGHWTLTRDSYLHFASEVGHQPTADAAALADAAGWLCNRRAQSAEGRQTATVYGVSWVMLWRDDEALIAGPRYAGQVWFAPLAPLLKSQGVRLALDANDVPDSTVRTAASTRLPWTLQVSTADPDADTRQFAARERFLLASAVLIFVFVCTGSYFIARTVNRELAVARLQSDFVAAVSHEFRTPLTLLRQTTEAFAEGRAGDAAQRQSFYEAQARATVRLHRLVESLLDFGRMEAGAKPYRLRPLELSEWVREVAGEFQREMAATGCSVEVNVDPELPLVDADSDALTHSLWNLLDNAVKYSPGCRTVWLSVGVRDGQVAIAVRDRGLGIPAQEQRDIFHKFVRGADSRLLGIKGAGIGLAMVAHIVEAHHGSISVDSKPGAGSTFTIFLPAKGGVCSAS